VRQENHSRLRCLEARLNRVQSFWKNEKAYADIVASGRYMKLCDVTGETVEAIDQATEGETKNSSSVEKANLQTDS